MRLTTKTNLAARALMACAVNPGVTLRTAEIAESCNTSLNHLLQVVNALQAHGFVETIRGRGGGLRLARPAEQISVGEVFRLFEAGVPFAECFAPEPIPARCRPAVACTVMLPARWKPSTANSMTSLSTI